MNAAELCVECSKTGRIRIVDWWVTTHGRAVPLCDDHAEAAVGAERFAEMVEQLNEVPA